MIAGMTTTHRPAAPVTSRDPGGPPPARPTWTRRARIIPSATDVVDELTVRMTRDGTSYTGIVSTSRLATVPGSWTGRVDLADTRCSRFTIRVLDRYSPSELVAQAVRVAAAAYPRGLGNPLEVVLGAGLRMDPLDGL